MNDRLVAAYSRPSSSTALRGSGDPDAAPIFILGLPRSGSTLLEQILASHPQVEGTGELPYVGRARDLAQPQPRRRHQLPGGDARARGRNLAALGADTSRSRGCTDARRAALHRQDAEQFPERRPHRADAAEREDHRRAPPPARCLPVLLPAAVRQGPELHLRPDRDRRVLPAVPADDGPLGRACCPGRVLTVQYEEVVSDFEPQVRRLLDFCGLPWEDACLRFYESERPCGRRQPSRCASRSTTARSGTGSTTSSHLGELIDVIAPIRERYRRYERA